MIAARFRTAAGNTRGHSAAADFTRLITMLISDIKDGDEELESMLRDMRAFYRLQDIIGFPYKKTKVAEAIVAGRLITFSDGTCRIVTGRNYARWMLLIKRESAEKADAQTVARSERMRATRGKFPQGASKLATRAREAS